MAPPVVIEDLGRVRVRIGDRLVEGSAIRRRALALLCLLLTRPQYTSTREEVVDHLWPDLEPGAAMNSLNQTVYFLRRVFEPHYVDDQSPGYLMQEGDLVWLDPDLVSSTSGTCLRLIGGAARKSDMEVVASLAVQYTAPFAADFTYDEWSVAYRDHLHASYLRLIEAAVQTATTPRDRAQAIQLAQRASQVDPTSEVLQLALVRLYRESGTPAAAAEQYEIYSRSLRELGVDPPSFPDV